MKKILFSVFIILILLAACNGITETPTPSPDTSAPVTEAPPPSAAVTAPVQVETPVPTPSPTSEPSPDQSDDVAAMIEGAFTALKLNDTSAVNVHMSYNELAGFVAESPFEKSEREKMAAEVFRRLSWTVKEVTLDGGAYNVVCEITNIDMISAVSQFMVDSTRLVSQNASLPDAERLSEVQINGRLAGMFITAVKATDVFSTASVTVKVEQDGGEWEIMADDALKNALTGGLDDALLQSGVDIYN